MGCRPVGPHGQRGLRSRRRRSLTLYTIGPGRARLQSTATPTPPPMAAGSSKWTALSRGNGTGSAPITAQTGSNANHGKLSPVLTGWPPMAIAPGSPTTPTAWRPRAIGSRLPLMLRRRQKLQGSSCSFIWQTRRKEPCTGTISLSMRSLRPGRAALRLPQSIYSPQGPIPPKKLSDFSWKTSSNRSSSPPMSFF